MPLLCRAAEVPGVSCGIWRGAARIGRLDPRMVIASLMTAEYDIGVDIGGTFTDVVCRGADGRTYIRKFPTTRSDPSRGVLAGLSHAAEAWGLGADQIGRFVHGTGYVTRQTSAAGFVIESADQAILRKENGEPVPGDVYLLRCGA